MTKAAFEKIAAGLREALEHVRENRRANRWMELDKFVTVDGVRLRAVYAYEVDAAGHRVGVGCYEWRECATGRLYRGQGDEAAGSADAAAPGGDAAAAAGLPGGSVEV